MLCPYCNNQADFISSKEFYGTDYGTNLYVCRPCDARVGTHGRSEKPLGTMANTRLRELRMQCHKYFDRKWKLGEMSRSKAYEWLQNAMNLTAKEAHIGMFNELQCEELLQILNINEERLDMSLMDAAAKILADGFDVKKGAVSDFEDLPEGTYEALLENVEWKVSDSGFEWLSLQFEILSEGFDGRKYFGMISFNNERFMNMNIKLAMRVAGAVGVELSPEDFEAPETSLVEAFEDGVGVEVDLTLTNWENKKTGKRGQNFIADEPQFE